MSPAKIREANEWLVRLRDEAVTAADRAEFEAWLDADPRHRDAYAMAVGELARMSRLRAGLRAYLETRPRPGLNRAPYAAAALAAAVFLLVAWFGLAVLNPTYSTATGEQRTVTLADGSNVELNTDTRLSVRYSDAVRRIRIERGEAVFDVVRDPTRAFVVEARGQTVRAVGTQFAVRVDSNAVSVLVIEGVVAVSENGKQTPVASTIVAPRLVAGQKLDLAGETPSLSTLQEAEMQRNLAWRTGWLEFNGQSLADAASEVARYTDARFTIDPQVRELKVWAYFRATDLDGFLSSLERNVPALRIERDNDSVRITRQAPASE
jgi:transmembrane sensor